MSAQLGVGKDGGRPMLENQRDNHSLENVPLIPDDPDETWWAAVLADEPLIEESIDQIISSTQDATAPLPSENVALSINWNKVQKLFDNDEIISLKVVSFNRGGVLVEDAEIQGFVPISHLIDLPINIPVDERESYLNKYLEKTIALKVIECDPAKERVVFSERAALAGAGQRKELLHNLAEGDIVSGCVTNITSFGVFVDLGGLEGLIHVSELSWGRVHHPSTLLNIGDQVSTMVIEILQDQGRVALSLKQLEKNPWECLSKTLSPGDVVEAVISNIVRYGAFARLDQGVEGLIHISSMTIPEDCSEVEDFLFEGQPVKVGIISIDPHKRRLGLSLERY